MLLLNFSHPLTGPQKSALEALLGGEVEVRTVPCHFDQSQPFAEQALALATRWASASVYVQSSAGVTPRA